VPADSFGLFIAPALTAFVSFSLMGFYSSLIPSLALESLHIRNHATNGAAIFFMSCCGVIAIAVSRRFSSPAVMFTALATLLPGVLLLVAARELSSLALLSPRVGRPMRAMLWRQPDTGHICPGREIPHYRNCAPLPACCASS